MDKVLDAIERLSSVIALLSYNPIDKEAIRALISGIIQNPKHKSCIEQGLAENNKAKIMRGIAEELSHYEAEIQKE